MEFSLQPQIPLNHQETEVILLRLLEYAKRERNEESQKEWLDELGGLARRKSWTPVQRAEVVGYYTSIIKALGVGEAVWEPAGEGDRARQVLHPLIFAVLEQKSIEPFTEYKRVWYINNGTYRKNKPRAPSVAASIVSAPSDNEGASTSNPEAAAGEEETPDPDEREPAIATEAEMTGPSGDVPGSSEDESREWTDEEEEAAPVPVKAVAPRIRDNRPRAVEPEAIRRLPLPLPARINLPDFGNYPGPPRAPVAPVVAPRRNLADPAAEQTDFFARRRALPVLEAQPMLDAEGQMRFDDQTRYSKYNNLPKGNPDSTKVFIKETFTKQHIRMDPSDGLKHALGYYVALEDIRDYVPQPYEPEHEDGTVNDFAIGLAARQKRERTCPRITTFAGWERAFRQLLIADYALFNDSHSEFQSHFVAFRARCYNSSRQEPLLIEHERRFRMELATVGTGITSIKQYGTGEDYLYIQVFMEANQNGGGRDEDEQGGPRPRRSARANSPSTDTCDQFSRGIPHSYEGCSFRHVKCPHCKRDQNHQSHCVILRPRAAIGPPALPPFPRGAAAGRGGL